MLTETQAGMKYTKHERWYHKICIPTVGSLAPDPRSEEKTDKSDLKDKECYADIEELPTAILGQVFGRIFRD